MSIHYNLLLHIASVSSLLAQLCLAVRAKLIVVRGVGLNAA
jgi:hypothetical protein